MPGDQLSKGGLQMRPTPQAHVRSFARLIGLVGGFLAALALPASAATVATDKPDYAPGQTVVITGSGWEPGETVVLVLHEDPPLDPDLQLTPVADANGDFINTEFIVDVFDIGVSFTLSAAGTSSGLTAVTTFTDACNRCHCGDGVLQTSENEECDLGTALNGAPGSCCKNNCTFANAGAACTDDSNPCTLDQCDGTSTTCQHLAGNAGAVCRAATDLCDLPEKCTGTSVTCPADNGPGDVQVAGTVCRAAAGPCDMAESCDGTNKSCPADAVQPPGTACSDDGNPCTLDQCDRTNGTCQHPA